MGKQQFSDGGFTGRCGNFVGQRWKKTLVLRTLGKCTNPRTPEQQKNRRRFSLCVTACKLAMQANYNCPHWQSDTTTEWARRMSASASLFGWDKNPLEYTPLLPGSVTPAYTNSSSPVLTANAVTCFFDTQDDIAGRVLSGIFCSMDAGTGLPVSYIARGLVSGSAGDWQAVFRLPNYDALPAGLAFCAISADDAAHDNKSILQPAFSLS